MPAVSSSDRATRLEVDPWIWSSDTVPAAQPAASMCMDNRQDCGKPGSLLAVLSCLPRVSEPLGRKPASSESCILFVDSLKAAGQQSQMRLTHKSRINIFPYL
ncbi:Uncharacterized protein HZ326_15335 [Fusarium oxysporum f. sp. albedinis]|nr:Uncharacterized protein HZ326_15335 [Fusarium oxysporum f. sp. albedinis]